MSKKKSRLKNVARHAPLLCPVCNYKVDSAALLSEDRGDVRPSDGSISLCLKCGEILRYIEVKEELTLAVCPQKILLELLQEQPKDFATLMTGQNIIRLLAKKN